MGMRSNDLSRSLISGSNEELLIGRKTDTYDRHSHSRSPQFSPACKARCSSLFDSTGAFNSPRTAGANLPTLTRSPDFFTSLSLPAPHMTALGVASIEFCGGILFALGILSRLTSLVLFVNMTMAYLSVPDDRVNFSHILSKPEDFYGASPYTYWFAALLILILGPGVFALDTLLKRRVKSTR